MFALWHHSQPKLVLQISEFKPRVCTSLWRMPRRNVHKIYFAEYAINLLPILVYWNRGTEQQKSETTTNTKCMNHYTSGWSWSTNDLRTIFYFIKTVIVRTLVVNILCWKVCWAVVVYQGVIYRSKCGGCVYACMPACDLWEVCHHHQHQLRGFKCQISKLRKICNICSFPPSQNLFLLSW